MFFDNFKKIINEKGIRIAQVERDCGFSRGAAYKWKEYYPSVDALLKMSKYLGVSVDTLLKGDEKWKKEE